MISLEFKAVKKVKTKHTVKTSGRSTPEETLRILIFIDFMLFWKSVHFEMQKKSA